MCSWHIAHQNNDFPALNLLYCAAKLARKQQQSCQLGSWIEPFYCALSWQLKPPAAAADWDFCITSTFPHSSSSKFSSSSSAMLQWAGPGSPVQVLANTKLAPWLKLGGVLYFLSLKRPITVESQRKKSMNETCGPNRQWFHRNQSYQVLKNWNVGRLKISLHRKGLTDIWLFKKCGAKPDTEAEHTGEGEDTFFDISSSCQKNARTTEGTSGWSDTRKINPDSSEDSSRQCLVWTLLFHVCILANAKAFSVSESKGLQEAAGRSTAMLRQGTYNSKRTTLKREANQKVSSLLKLLWKQYHAHQKVACWTKLENDFCLIKLPLTVLFLPGLRNQGRVSKIWHLIILVFSLSSLFLNPLTNIRVLHLI